jgi:cellulose synthase/poly-beta-1,6-N-acetylglucosamine synthase-like glycosyltransferase
VDFLYRIEGYVLVNMIEYSFPMETFYLDRALFSVTETTVHEFTLPLFSQILFLIFFPAMAFTSRINLRMRAKILLFGLFCFFAFIVSQFLVISSILVLGLDVRPESYVQISIFATVATGGLFIELMLFSTLTIPNRTKIKPVIKRKYTKEYVTLIGLLAASSVLVYFLLNVLDLTIDSPITVYFALNVVTIIIFSYYLSFFIYALRKPSWLRWADLPTDLQNGSPLSISFLLSARNEEKIIARCIKSLDVAASKYSGKTEIITVNDGSTDKTETVAEEALSHLSYASGRLFSLPPSGKGYALQYGLARTSGDIIFRIDADSVLEENAIWPIMTHFNNPEVGSVSGMIFPLEPKSIWQKSVSLMYIYYMTVVKRGQELFDSILVQAGAFSVFRKDALLKIGGWVTNQFGEDGEITNRMARYGYRNELELQALLYSEVPHNLTRLIYQRSRWSIAFYHARGRNLDIVTSRAEYRSPRSIIFLIALLTHGLSFAHGLVLPYLAATFLTGSFNISLEALPSFLGLSYKFALIQAIILVLQIAVIAYGLSRFKKLSYIAYFPFLRIIGFILSTIVRPQALEVLLYWSSKRKKYDDNSYQELMKEMKKSVDPVGL